MQMELHWNLPLGWQLPGLFGTLGGKLRSGKIEATNVGFLLGNLK